MVDIFQQIKEKANLYDILSYYQIEIFGSSFKCPFHNDSSPSAGVFANGQMYKCHVCDITGDAIDFVARMENIQPLDAARFISQIFNIVIDKLEFKRIKAINKLINISRMGITNEILHNISAHYQISISLLQKIGIGFYYGGLSEEEENLIGGKGLRNRIIFPYKGDNFFVARSYPFDKDLSTYKKKPPKYRKPKGVSDRLFQLDKLENVKYIFIVEGVADALSIYPFLPDDSSIIAVSSATINKPQERQIKKIKDKIFIILPDNDDSGIKGANRTKYILKDMGIVSFIPSISYPKGFDPNDAVKNGYINREYLESCLKEAEFIKNLDKEREDNHLFKNIYIDFDRKCYFKIRSNLRGTVEEDISKAIIKLRHRFFELDDNGKEIETDYGWEIETFYGDRFYIKTPIKIISNYNKFNEYISSNAKPVFLCENRIFKDIIMSTIDFYQGRGLVKKIFKIRKVGRTFDSLFVTSDGIIKDGHIYRPDKEGIINIKDKYYYIDNTIEANITINTNNIMEDFINDIYDLYGELGVLALGWLSASLFKDKIVERFRGFPIIQVPGKPGTGKTTFMELMAKISGFKSVWKLSDSLAAMRRKISEYVNYPIFYDEYNEKSEIRKELVKNIFDNGRISLVDKDINIVKDFNTFCTAMMGGEYEFEDPALAQRAIRIYIKKVNNFNNKYYKFISKYRESLNSFFSYVVMSDYNIDILNIMDHVYNNYYSLISQFIDNERIVNKYLVLLVGFKILEKSPFSLPITIHDFYNFILDEYIKNNLNETDEEIYGDILVDFFETILEYISSDEKINIEKYFTKTNRENIWIDLNRLYSFAKIKKIKFLPNKKTLIGRLKEIAKYDNRNGKKQYLLKFGDKKAKYIYDLINSYFPSNNISNHSVNNVLKFKV